MGSQWAGLVRRCAEPRPSPKSLCIISLPRRRMPVPASMMIRGPDLGRTSTHDVLPPYRFVWAPGTGNDPRTPQKRIFIASPTLTRRFPLIYLGVGRGADGELAGAILRE